MAKRTCECCSVIELLCEDLEELAVKAGKGQFVGEELYQTLELARGARRQHRRVYNVATFGSVLRGRTPAEDVPGQLFIEPLLQKGTEPME